LYTVYNPQEKKGGKITLNYNFDKISRNIAHFLYETIRSFVHFQEIDVKPVVVSERAAKRSIFAKSLKNWDLKDGWAQRAEQRSTARLTIMADGAYYPKSYDNLIKCFYREKTVAKPLIEGEKVSVFKFLLREYIFKFNLCQGHHETSAIFAGKAVNLLLRYTYANHL
jgi:hypothetical protein